MLTKPPALARCWDGEIAWGNATGLSSISCGVHRLPAYKPSWRFPADKYGTRGPKGQGNIEHGDAPLHNGGSGRLNGQKSP